MTRPVCLITGASGRLGLMLCQTLLPRYSIIAVYRTQIPDLPSQLIRPLDAKAKSDQLFCVQGDLANRHDIQRVVEVSLARFGQIDAVINAAADTHFHGKVVELWQAADYPQSQMLCNAIAPMQLVSLIFERCWRDSPKENARKNRCVLNVSSYSGIFAYDNTSQAFYGASKAALNLLTLYLSLELAPYSVRANVICPNQFNDQAATQGIVNTMVKVLAGTMTGAVVKAPEGTVI